MTVRERVEEMPEKAKRIQQKPQKAKLTHKYSTPLLIALCIILAVVTIILVYMMRNHIAAKDGAKEQLRLSAIAGFDCEYSEAQQLYPFQSGLLKVSNKRVAYLSISGNEIYSVDLETASPVCIQNGPYAMVADTEGFLCALFSEEGMVYKTHMTGKIGNVALAPSGLSAVIIDDADSFGSVYIMEKDSTFLAKWSSHESGYPLSLAFSPDESTLSVSLVDTDGSQMIPHMKQFSIPKDRTTARPSEYAFYTPISSDIMPILAYMSNEKVAIAGISDVPLECEVLQHGLFGAAGTAASAGLGLLLRGFSCSASGRSRLGGSAGRGFGFGCTAGAATGGRSFLSEAHHKSGNVGSFHDWKGFNVNEI